MGEQRFKGKSPLGVTTVLRLPTYLLATLVGATFHVVTYIFPAMKN